MSEPKQGTVELVQMVMGIPRQTWIDDANIILELLKDHPDRAGICFRLGLLHSIINTKP